MFSPLQEGGHQPATNERADASGEEDQANLDSIGGEDVEGGLGKEAGHGVEDHAGDGDDDEEDRKFANAGKESGGKERLLGEVEVVDEAGDESDCADDYGSNDRYTSPWMCSCACPGQTNKENCKTCCIERNADEVELFDFLPASLLIILTGS